MGPAPFRVSETSFHRPGNPQVLWRAPFSHDSIRISHHLAANSALAEKMGLALFRSRKLRGWEDDRPANLQEDATASRRQ
jgi:hypothetical protein